jgi:uncharacterized membrane protein
LKVNRFLHLLRFDWNALYLFSTCDVELEICLLKCNALFASRENIGRKSKRNYLFIFFSIFWILGYSG